MMRLGFALWAGALLAVSSSALASERAIVVLDGSGSMWGQIDGEPKIGIARDVLGTVLSTMPGDIELGLLAYGHREKGNCSDIELLVPPAAGSAEAVAAAAQSISPKGKTPLSASVKQAAEMLRYTEDRATVVLITDGLETCGVDPCALAKELETGGVDFTAHVVGFGLSAEEGRQVACLAEETGGNYFQAGDAEALGQALSETVAVIAEPELPVQEEEPSAPAELPVAALNAPDTIEIGRPLTIGWEGPGARYDRIVLVDPTGNNGQGRDVRTTRVISGDLDNRTVRVTAPVTPGDYDIEYRFERHNVVATRPISVVETAVSLSAPAGSDIGSTVTVGWVGPGGQRDTVQLFDPTARQGEGVVIREQRLVTGDFDGRTVKLILPTEPGFYQLRYWNRDDRKVLASRQIEVLEAEVSLNAPDTVDMGRTFQVSWIGPGANRDSVEIFDPSGDNGKGRVVGTKRVVTGDFENRTVDLIAPTKTGTYELRYWNGDSRDVLAVRPVEVVALDVTISAPDTVDIGRSFDIAWTGPGAHRDSMELFNPAGNNGNGKVIVSKRLVNGDFDANMVDLLAPTDPGDYQLRYWSGDGRTVLATRPIAVVATEVSVTAPATADIGRTIIVSWVGPGAHRDSAEVFDPTGDNGKGKVVFSKRLSNGDYDAQTVDLIVPVEPGNYEIRYWDGVGRKALAIAPIEILDAEVSLSAADTVPAGERFPVAWVGPGAYRDSVEVVAGDPMSAKPVAGTRLVNGDYDAQTVQVKAPEEPGTYTLRYWNGDFRKVLATRPITVE